MAATVRINEFNGAAAGTPTNGVAFGHWISLETASISDTVKDNNPIAKPVSGFNYSFEKWHKLEITNMGGSVRLQMFRHYISDGLPGSGWNIFTSANASPTSPTPTTPVATVSSFATTAMPSADPGAAHINPANLTATGSTSMVVTQLRADNTVTAGFTKTVTWAWDEVA